MRWWGLLLIGLLINPVLAGPEDIYSLKIKAFLQGAHSASTPGLMHDTLRQKDLIPVTQPFNNDKFAYQGTESINPDLLDISDANAVVDWVLIELRDPDDPTLIAARKAVLLQRDGDITDPEQAEESLSFSGLDKTSYYIALHHRNHLGTMTGSPVTLEQDSTITVDFSNSETTTNHEHDRVINTGNPALLRAGYINADQRIIASGPGNDLSEILTKVLTAEGNSDLNTNFIASGYLDSDLNMDGQTTFTGPGNDSQILLGNILSHPQNENFAGNYVINAIKHQEATISNLPVELILSDAERDVIYLEGYIDDGNSYIPLLGGWNGSDQIKKIYLKITDSQGYITPETIFVPFKGWQSIYHRININSGLPIGSYETIFSLQACQDANCNTVYSNGLINFAVNIEVAYRINKAPVASIGWGNTTEETYSFGSMVYLGVDSSQDPDGDLLSYHWSVLSKPEGSALQLNPNQGDQYFGPDLAGTYIIEFYVNDGQVNSEVLTITLHIQKPPPQAKLTHSDLLKVGTAIVLDAGTSIPDPELLRYTWGITTPEGSLVTLENTDQINTQFTPDIPGEYHISLAVSNGETTDHSSTFLQVRPENSPPTAAIGNVEQYTYIEQVVTLDAGSSSDFDGDTLSYQWSLISTPEDSSTTLSSNTGQVITLTPDMTGKYQLQLIVNDGLLDSEPLEISITASNEVPLLTHNVIDAEFSQSLNRVVTIGTNPNKLYIIDPLTQQEISVDLPLAPKNVSVGPDGQFAAVGHDAWVSHIDLESATRLNTYSITADAADIVLDGKNYAHVVPSAGFSVKIHSVNLETGEETMGSGGSINVHTQIKLHSSGEYLYGADRGSSPSDLDKLDISSGSAVQLYDSIYHGDYDVCGDLWLSEDGLRIFSKCKNVFRSHAANNRAQDMHYNGQLTELDAVEHLSHSSAANLVFALAIEDEDAYGDWYWHSEHENVTRHLNIYGYDSLDYKGSIDLDDIISYGRPYHSNGRFVFVNAEGTEIYVITQAEKNSGLDKEFGLLTYPVDHPSQITNTNSQGELAAKALSKQDAYLGQTVTLDGSASSGNVQSYQWQLLKAPEGSNAVLTNDASAKAGFKPDTLGQYNFSLVVNDGETDSTPQITTLEVHEPIALLNHRVIDAEYSLALDQIASIGTSPNKLYLTDPVTHLTRSVDLTKPPTALSISPNGQLAIVGHDQFVTFIALNNLQIINSYPASTDIIDIVLTDNGSVYIAPQKGYKTLYGLHLSDGSESEQQGYFENSRIKLHPTSNSVYAANRDVSPSDLDKFDISSFSPARLYDSPYHGDYEACGNLWLSEDGARIFGRCAYVYRTSTERDKDMLYNGKLSGLNHILHLTHSAAANQIFAIPEDPAWYQNDIETNSQELKIYDYDFLLHNRTINLSDFVANNKVHNAHGRFVFTNSAGTKIYVIAQADEHSGILNDYGLITYPIDYQPPTTIPEDFTTHQQKWLIHSETEGKIQYQTQQNCNCESAVTSPMTITERHQRIYNSEYTDNAGHIDDYDIRNSLLTITQRLEQLQDAYNTGAHKIEVSYDLQYGFPASVFIDYNEFIADDEVSYTISDFSITPD